MRGGRAIELCLGFLPRKDSRVRRVLSAHTQNEFKTLESSGSYGTMKSVQNDGNFTYLLEYGSKDDMLSKNRTSSRQHSAHSAVDGRHC